MAEKPFVFSLEKRFWSNIIKKIKMTSTWKKKLNLKSRILLLLRLKILASFRRGIFFFLERKIWHSNNSDHFISRRGKIIIFFFFILSTVFTLMTWLLHPSVTFFLHRAWDNINYSDIFINDASKQKLFFWWVGESLSPTQQTVHLKFARAFFMLFFTSKFRNVFFVLFQTFSLSTV